MFEVLTETDASSDRILAWPILLSEHVIHDGYFIALSAVRRIEVASLLDLQVERLKVPGEHGQTSHGRQPIIRAFSKIAILKFQSSAGPTSGRRVRRDRQPVDAG